MAIKSWIQISAVVLIAATLGNCHEEEKETKLSPEAEKNFVDILGMDLARKLERVRYEAEKLQGVDTEKFFASRLTPEELEKVKAAFASLFVSAMGQMGDMDLQFENSSAEEDGGETTEDSEVLAEETTEDEEKHEHCHGDEGKCSAKNEEDEEEEPKIKEEL